VTQRGVTPDAAIDAALQIIQRALQEVRAIRRVRAAMSIAKGEALRTYAASAARQA
jgi:hypothetical protein